MRKMVCALWLTVFLLFTVAEISQAGSLGFWGFTIGDSIPACAAQMRQLQAQGQIDRLAAVNENQIAIYMEINHSPATLILTFTNGNLASLLVATYASPSLQSVAQQIRVELPGLIKKFGVPTSVNNNIERDMAHHPKFANAATWEYEDGEEIFVGVYYNGQVYRMFMIMQQTTTQDQTFT